ncbi:hypothetical protein L798_04428 [Zootermopsis nevadensis]|uniref:Uncharacterized protein n=1 Tax=Zootermopsis nevadensis TaxID=136037 RepID=A0A067QSS9_ZOONE|nr:hypothetical protein L798_04428 [Zootermopsis nevadensis]
MATLSLLQACNVKKGLTASVTRLRMKSSRQKSKVQILDAVSGDFFYSDNS